MIKTLTRAMDGLDAVLRHFGVVLMVLVFGVAVLQVLIRYVFGIPMVWTEEVARNLLVWMAFLLMGPALKQGLHYSVDYLANRLTFTGKLWLYRLGDVIILAFAIAMVLIGTSFTVRTADAHTAALEISTGWISGALPVGAAILALYALARLLVSFCDPTSGVDRQHEELQL